MAKSVATVWVPVDDMDRAKKFYGETLHFEVGKETPEWSEVDAGNLTIGLNAREGTSAHADGGAVITFTPEGGIDAEVERLQAEGVTFTGGISDHPWGRIAPFKDSEGNDLQLYAPPAD
ncbi:VOC family protein [Microlunatus antarcticus]|uniref:Putative enzyme related to lactoylglutathione lyase n=1 Tax=Microlunatus antarcticus TaxID=53388 RepID=A0A7W5JY09_9ACTN|nr:VOC family protein [Microlunatus antarcticus]MBB3328434.1 putative enzyme related to lactoylglutathione lyase [Microlunatus antarcticus]